MSNQKISIIAIVKNEGEYIAEWIEYHKIIGFNHFYIYDDNSTDNINEILKPYISSGIATYDIAVKDGDLYTQMQTYQLAVDNYGLSNDYMIGLDIDEFIVLRKHCNIQEFLHNLRQQTDFSQLLIPWMLFGTSGHKTKPNGLVIENFLYRNRFGANGTKPIFVPIKLTGPLYYPHFIQNIAGNTVDEHGNIIDVPKYKYGDTNDKFIANHRTGRNLVYSNDLIAINHYRLKSLQEFKDKAKAQSENHPTHKNFRQKKENIQKYLDENDKNEVLDTCLLSFVEQIKHNIAQRSKQ